jgi:hypothetical protein
VNALEVIEAAASDIGIPVPGAALASTDQQVRQLVQLLNKEGRALSRRYRWQALIRECTFVTVAAESQGTLVSLVGSNQAIRDIIVETFYNRSTMQAVLGPVTPQEWQAIKASNATSPHNQFRIRGNSLLFTPTPTAGHTCAFEYVTKEWCTNDAGDEFRDALETDDDEFLLDSELMLLGLIWRWKKAKGFDYGEDFAEYERQVNDAISKDGVKRRLNVSGHALDGRGRPTIPRLIGS